MIPKIIHYCWFGRGEMPQLAINCIASWHKFMPDWEYKLWNEDNFNVNDVPYVKEAYEAKKYAFVTDYVRLYALSLIGGVYMDVDFEVFQPFEPLLDNNAFAGYEGSKHSPVMMGILASEPGGCWIKEQIEAYYGRHFLMDDGTYDYTTNVSFITRRMIVQGFVCDGVEKSFHGLHVYPVDYFCPRQTTGEYLKTENTFCEHKGLHSWSETSWKSRFLKYLHPEISIKLIKLKRKVFND